MNCTEPGLIRDDELLAYGAGESVRPVVEQHLTHCPRCADQLAHYRRLEALLTHKLYRWDCPPNQVLGEYQLGLLDAGLAQAVRTHLNACVLCSVEVSVLGQFLAGDPMLVAQTAPASAVANEVARTNHRSQPQEIGAALNRLLDGASAEARRIIATLLPQPPRLAYQRSTAPAILWPRRYAAEDFHISLQVERESSRADLLQLIGFVTREDTPLETLQGMPILLSSPAGKVSTQTVDDLGNFVFPMLAPGMYTLELQTATGMIVIEPVPVEIQEI